MSNYLLQLALGPVQDFIAAARRTRDLWFGSHLLSELSKAAAKSLADAGALLIFPAPRDAADLDPWDGPVDEQGNHAFNVANKILCRLTTDDPAALAAAARAAAQARLEQLAGKARVKAKGLIEEGKAVDDDWAEQLRTVLEFVAAWVEIDSVGEYPAARSELDQAIAGRKNLREFQPWRDARPKVPKSSLDGERTSVLRPPADRAPVAVRKYRLGTNEQLDAIGVLKRCGGEPDQFVPLRNVAVGAWLAAAARHQTSAECLAKLETACRPYNELLAIRRPKTPVAVQFPFDADVLFEDRWRAISKESGFEVPETVQAAVRDLVRANGRRVVGPPPAYVCCLVADGDQMGNALNQLKTPEQHQAFSRALAAFAPVARRVIEEEHLGALVFVGGDDVLAFLPVHTAVAAANRLRAEFNECMAKEAPAGHVPTLSVGLGIGHALTGMGDLLELGRDAERLAKRGRHGQQGRDALAIHVQKRSGGADVWFAPWASAPADTLAQARDNLGPTVPRGKVSEVRAALRRMPEPTKLAAAEHEGWQAVLAGEARRIISRAGIGLDDDSVRGGLRLEDVKLDLAAATYTDLYQAVADWIDLQRVAMVLAEAQPLSERNEEGRGDA